MINNCKADKPLKSFHCENLNSELFPLRKVLEPFSQNTKLVPTNDQLCGLGFNETVPSKVILRLSGSHIRTIKLIF
jgi:hypothetical protein